MIGIINIIIIIVNTLVSAFQYY